MNLFTPLDVSSMKHRNILPARAFRRWPGTAPLLLLLMAGHAHAQWQVTDEVTHQGLENVDSTLKNQTNKRLEELGDQQRIGSAQKSAEEDPQAPGVSLDKDRPATIQSTITVETLRCGEKPDAGKGILRDRWTVCSEIVRTELAQYNYALSIREVAIQRQTRLKDIEDARGRLSEGYQDAGKLQSNNNELLALLARMEVDKQQYRTYMDAYASRLTYLQSLREALGQQAINGKKKNTLGEIALGAGAMGALKLALDEQKTERKTGRFK